METYIIRCFRHFPGYEIFFARNEKEAVDKVFGWKGCHVDIWTLCKVKNLNDSDEISKRKGWMEKFIQLNKTN